MPGNTHHHTSQHHHATKHRSQAVGTVAHAESAVGAGKKYEDPREGRNETFDSFNDLVKHNHDNYGKGSNKESRGARIDRELAEEDQEIIEHKNEMQSERVPGTKK
ncbi:hypothetical protein BCR43DRAFT_482738 [Syncephalastrum racemosum]|uniref:Uncharacterized protein n=1 Tax=Syncephalastrum racemosum TaxID=13706 RepID=A0A1X2HUC3_SYNRA|nr:hypothetical protein BCR43DRAFT_482738 [Syncephalastrum racemosum]